MLKGCYSKGLENGRIESLFAKMSASATLRLGYQYAYQLPNYKIFDNINIFFKYFAHGNI